MSRRTCALLLVGLLAMPALAQKAQDRVAADENAKLMDAQSVLRAAEQAGAPTYARSLYDEAAYKLKFAQENWNASKDSRRNDARLQAVEALWAARAALAKARWIGTNAALRSLQSDITRLGGRTDLNFPEESPDIALNRGTTSRERIQYAQSIIDAAKAAGGMQVAADDLRTAEQNLGSARKITSSVKNNENADYLAYLAEMMARRALYTARLNDVNRHVAPLQMQRTQLAQLESERAAAAERAQREAAQRQAEELQRQLAQEQASRQAQQAELDRLRQQIEENRRATEQRIESDRLARVQAEQNLDRAFAQYESAVASGSAAEIETLRRQIEDQEIALRVIQQREALNEQSMQAEIERLRNELAQAQGLSPEVRAQRQADVLERQQQLDTLRREREAALARRSQVEQQHQNAVTEATRRRQETEAQAQALRAQMEQAQQQAQQAAQAATAAQQAAEQARQQAAQSQQSAEQMRSQAEKTQAELERARLELAQRDEEARRLRMENELARIAATKREARGFVVTLSGGILFDTGKSVVKPGAKNTLQKIAEQLKTDEKARVAVEGHTDSVGSDESNQALSQKRAEAVRDVLVAAGVPAEKITATGRGESQPVATNKTVAGRQQNRRVELVITNQ
jgi:outer membrane protein OmpA-like peptidoglycan-associated protein